MVTIRSSFPLKQLLYQIEVRQVFQQISSEASSHAQLLDLVPGSKQLQDCADIYVVPRVSRDKIKAARKPAEEIFVRVGRGGLSVEEDLRLAVRMEEEFMKVHIHHSLYFRDAEISGSCLPSSLD